MRALQIAGIVLVAGSIFAGCGGGGSSNPHGTSSGNTSSKGAQYTVKVKIPSASGSSSNAVRRAKYVSPSVQSIVVQIFSGSTQIVQGDNYVNVTATGSNGASGCASGAGGVTCTVVVNASIATAGTYTVVVATYDAQQTATCAPSGTPACSGNLLSISNLPQDVTPGSTISLTLGGIPAYLQPVELLSGYISAQGSAITVYGPGPQTVSFEFLDADHNVIIGAGAPSVTSLGNTASTLTATVTTSGGSGLYTLHLAPVTTLVGGVQVVQSGTVSPAFSVAVPNTSLTANVVLPIAITHSVLYVSGSPPSPPGTDSIYVYFDGNTTPSYNVYDTGYTPLNIATDISGNVWGTDYGNNKVIEFSAQPASPPNENDPSPGPSGFAEPYVIAFDSSGDAFVGNGSPRGVVQFNAPSPQNTPDFASSMFTYSSDPNLDPQGIAFNESNGMIYVSYYNSSSSQFSVVGYPGGSSSGTTLYGPGSTSTNGVAIDPLHGYIWFVAGTSVVEINPAGTQITSITGGSPAGVATDSLGNVFVTNSGGGIKEYAAPSFSSPTTIGSVVSPVSVAVYPNSVIGIKSPVGVLPNPTPSPIPIPTPS